MGESEGAKAASIVCVRLAGIGGCTAGPASVPLTSEDGGFGYRAAQGCGRRHQCSKRSLCADCWPWWLCCWPCSVCPALQRGGQLRSSRRAWGQSKVRRRQIIVCARLAGLSGCAAGKDTRAACFYLKQREASGHQGGGGRGTRLTAVSHYLQVGMGSEAGDSVLCTGLTGSGASLHEGSISWSPLPSDKAALHRGGAVAAGVYRFDASVA